MRDFSHIHQDFVFCYDDSLLDSASSPSITRGNEIITRQLGKAMEVGVALVRKTLYAVDDAELDCTTPAQCRVIRKLREFLLDIRMQRYEAQKCFSYVNMNTGKSVLFLNGHFFDVQQSSD